MYWIYKRTMYIGVLLTLDGLQGRHMVFFAPWLNGATNCIAGGRFSPEQWYSMIEEFKVTIWYTAPTALRMLMSAGDDIVNKYDLSSLRAILSVGEPLNPEVIKWAKRFMA